MRGSALSGKMCIRDRSLAASCASAGEFKQRLSELAALNGVLFELSQNLFLNRQGLTKVKDSLLAKVSLKAFHNQSLVALHAWAYICTGTASGTIQGGNRDCKLVEMCIRDSHYPLAESAVLSHNGPLI